MPTYDVAISFAGEDRPVAEQLAGLIVTRGLNVFYDEYAKAELWGKDLYAHLSKVYRTEAKYCLMLISEHYSKKQWTNHERRAAQARAIAESTEYILPLRLDDSSVEGVLDTVAFIDYRKTPQPEIIDLLARKVHEYNRLHGIAYEIVRVQDVFAKQGIGPKGGKPVQDSDMRTVCPSCGAEQTLAEAKLTLQDDETVYSCKSGCQPLVVVGRPGVVAWPGRGYRLGEHVVRNVRDIVFRTDDMAESVVINASQAALIRPQTAG